MVTDFGPFNSLLLRTGCNREGEYCLGVTTTVQMLVLGGYRLMVIYFDTFDSLLTHQYENREGAFYLGDRDNSEELVLGGDGYHLLILYFTSNSPSLE